jgi:hypothetical protein
VTLNRIAGKDPSVTRKRLNKLPEVVRVKKGKYRLRDKNE